MKIKPDELIINNYVLIDKLAHNELVPFIRTYLKKRTKYAVIFYLINLVVFCLAVYFYIHGYSSPDYDPGDRFKYFAYGLAIAFALVPLHEYIHVLAYKSQGATKTSYDANFKKFYFMALADKFVANKKEFEVVALAPFVIITTVLTILLFILSSDWTLTIIAILLAHTAMCSGDFGLLSYFEFNKDKNVVTYDDIENKVTYFFGRTNETKYDSITSRLRDASL